jgi:beta-N-acetylhexosaminidase
MSPSAIRRQVGQLLLVGFDGQQVPVELRALAREFGLGGVVLFDRNIAAPDQVAGLCYEVGRLVPDLPPWVSVDQEGGRVARLKAPFTEWPAAQTLGRSGDAALAARFGRAMASELRAVGITLDFAPVLDVRTNPKNTVIGDRAISGKAEDVARLGAAVVRAMQEEGVAACGKHFPGHGDAAADSHVELPLVEHGPERLREVEFLPFRAAIDAGVASIMTAHILVPALDGERPATLSKHIVTDVLRRELGYEGLILSDDLVMKAIANEYPLPSAAVLAVQAGCDGLLICQNTDHHAQGAALEALIHAVEDDRLPFSRVEDALKRQRRAKERFLAAAVASRPPSARTLRDALDRGEHRAIADEMARFA